MVDGRRGGGALARPIFTSPLHPGPRPAIDEGGDGSGDVGRAKGGKEDNYAGNIPVSHGGGGVERMDN